jgi:hypothetical protein
MEEKTHYFTDSLLCHQRRESVVQLGDFRPQDEPRVPHISLVFREMWDTTALSPPPFEAS